MTQIDTDNVTRYLAAGGVVVCDDRVLVLRRPSRGEVRLPKGHVEPGEAARATALREVREESGYDGLRVQADLGEQTVEFDHQGNHVVRTERYFLMALDDPGAMPAGGERQFEPEWLAWDDALQTLTFEAEREWVRRARRARRRRGEREPMTEFKQTKWTLEELLPTRGGEELERVLTDLEARVSDFESCREWLSAAMTGKEFLEIVRQLEEIYAISGRLSAYAYLWFSEDTQSQKAISFVGRIDQLSADLQNRLLFFSLWWKGLDEENAGRLLVGSGDYAYYLESLRRFKPYTLSEPEEKVINVKDVNGASALIKLYDVITNRFTFRLEVEGEVKEMTRAELAAYVRDPSPDVRAAAYQELYRVYGDQATVLGQIYSHRARDWASEQVALRGFESPVSVRNLENDIPDPVVETLLDVCRANMPVFHRYFRFKARRLGMDRLRRYDVYAPLGSAEKAYPFPEAAEQVLDSLGQFSPRLADHARRVLADAHLDSEIRRGKRGGAFCYSVLPGMTPWVLVNYVGKADDVRTLAHELGHAVHGLMAADHSVLTFHSALPLAETASVFSEMLLTDRLLGGESDPAVRRDLLVLTLDDAYATIARQAYFVLYEIEAHVRAVENATTDELCALYLDNLRDQFGDALDLSDDFRWEWTAIPHIYERPFYCYAYSFGQLLVLALYRQYKEEGAAFVPRYLKILEYGGSASPEHIIREAGFDMRAPEFWQGGFDVLSRMMDELEALA
jgi:oligoendopeptidase F